MKHIPQILTSEIGEKWIQPEIPKLPQVGDRIESLHRLSKGERGTVTGIYPNSISYQPDGKDHEVYLIIGQFSIIKEEKNCSNCKRSLAIKEGLYCFHKNAIVKPEGHCKKFEPEPPHPEPSHQSKCPDCQFYNFEYKAHWGKDGYFEDKSKPIHSCLKHLKYLDNLDGCDQFQPKSKSPSKTCGPCSECNSFDTSIPKDSLWQFCLSKGKYLPQNELEGCEDFKPIVPYQSPSKSRRTRGDGSGQIQLHYYKAKSGKSYEQYYYHYEIRENGMRQRKGSRYIPAAKLDLIREMEADKKPVVTILHELDLIV
jgi:hypothetical protein